MTTLSFTTMFTSSCIFRRLQHTCLQLCNKHFAASSGRPIASIGIVRNALNLETSVSPKRFVHVIKQNRPIYWNIDPRAMETDDWLHIQGKYKVCAWSVSGVETCIVVSTNDFAMAFDMGYSFPASVKCEHVFISHGHMDHISGIAGHASKRALYSMPPATYYVPPHLVESIEAIVNSFSLANEKQIKLKIRSANIDEEIKLPGNIWVKPFPTVHRVCSQGYIVYKTKKKLKPEFQGQATQAIGSLVKEGADIFDIEHIPQVAYTGDTTSAIYNPPHNPDLLKVELLITESTYIDNENKGGKCTILKAQERGHTHLDEITQMAPVLKDVSDIILIHFSDKYSTKYILKQTEEKLIGEFKKKVHLGLAYQKKFDFKR